MRERVAQAMHEVWSNRCRELCRGVEFGRCTALNQARYIQMARVEAEREKIVGLFHVKYVGNHEFAVMDEQLFQPPFRHWKLLRPFYVALYSQWANETGTGFTLIPKSLLEADLA
jgi:hypothetical protein